MTFPLIGTLNKFGAGGSTVDTIRIEANTSTKGIKDPTGKTIWSAGPTTLTTKGIVNLTLPSAPGVWYTVTWTDRASGAQSVSFPSPSDSTPVDLYDYWQATPLPPPAVATLVSEVASLTTQVTNETSARQAADTAVQQAAATDATTKANAAQSAATAAAHTDAAAQITALGLGSASTHPATDFGTASGQATNTANIATNTANITANATAIAGKVDKPAAGTPVGYVPTVQADGSIAYASTNGFDGGQVA